jgi:hypothetical protein
VARGDSGRIVVEVDPGLKRELYVELARRGTTLKAWFTANARDLVSSRGQLNLFEADHAFSTDVDAPMDTRPPSGR